MMKSFLGIRHMFILVTIRAFLLFIYFSICLLGFVPVVFIRPRHPNLTYLFSSFFAPVACRILGLSIKKEGLHHYHDLLQEKKSCVIIANHQSNWDLLSACLLIPPRCITLGKGELFLFPVFGQIYYLTGNQLIYRQNKFLAKKSMNSLFSYLRRTGAHVLIMPEGTRHQGQTLAPFKKGAFKLAENLETLIYPVIVSPWKKIQWGKLKSGTLTITYLPPFPSRQQHSTKKTPEEIRDYAYQAMNASYQQNL
jgi:1-acyl-sn-glycerol-3-phosphate acyltransferase